MSMPAEEAEAAGPLLLALARQAITLAVTRSARGTAAPEPSEPFATAAWLRRPGACFVTLTMGGRLRGCIGSVRARRPLLDDLRSNARAAALSDPRFPPLTAAELPQVRIEVSLLSAPTELPAADLVNEAAALAALRPGVDGLILEHEEGAQATFLPQVWENLVTPRAFLTQLKLKAGLPAGFWSPAIRLSRYTVRKWQEPPESPRSS
jgi:AmmeMemoRadiSam system protein A